MLRSVTLISFYTDNDATQNVNISTTKEIL